MALSSDVLAKNISDLTKKLLSSKTAPTAVDVGKAWGDAYHGYASQAMTIPPSSLVPTSDPSLIAAVYTGAPGAFSADLANGISAYWTACLWTPTAFTGGPTIALAPPLLAILLGAMAANLASNAGLDQAVQMIAS